MKVLIIGLGSIAQKHIHVLNELVPEIELYALRSSKPASDQENIKNLYNWEDLDSLDFHFALVSSPSIFHLDHIEKLLSLNIPLIVEKPLFVNKQQIERFEQIFNNQSLIYVACNFRFHPLIEYIKEYLNNHMSKINEVNAYCGSFLPDWRPSADYRQVYSARNELGGGVHLDLIHEPDYLVHLFGMPKSTRSNHRKVSNLEIDTFDTSNYLFQYDSFQAQVCLNYFRKDTKRTLEIIRENDTLLVDFVSWQIKDLTQDKIIFEDDERSIYTTYKKQMKYFLSCIEKKQVPLNNAFEAIEILKCVL
ncbi:Gfo/Idh/MocA family oxidoreductase [uncultured Aquimarina sp.]|uniref:Gfo/Idh/MocA family protein n=1 Tax=uncultured Aquimarina sp. TaxID=575652 RepID=UPI002602A621|nr:Gfo/Idh/MocA family oxidoreductase [uncultured Aquimarina sp.]